MFKIKINPEQCEGCSLCVNDCLTHDIELRDGKATPLHQNCFKCGHCIAICPQNAVSLEDGDMSEIKDYKEESFTINYKRYNKSEPKIDKTPGKK